MRTYSRFLSLVFSLLLVSGFAGQSKIGGGGPIFSRIDKDGEPIVVLTNRHAVCEWRLKGAQLISCAFVGDAHALAYVPRAGYAFALKPGEYSHGGIAPAGALRTYRLDGVTDGSEGTTVAFVSEDGACTCRYTVGDHCLNVGVTGSADAGLRSYLSVSDSAKVVCAERADGMVIDDASWHRRLCAVSTDGRPLRRFAPETVFDNHARLHPYELPHFLAFESQSNATVSVRFSLETLVGRRDPRRREVTNELPTLSEPLSDLLVRENGKRLQYRGDWKGRQRELRKILQREEYGFRPCERPDGLVFERIAPDRIMMDGAAVRKRIRARWKGPVRDGSFAFTAFVPTTARAKAPSFLLICNRDPKKNIDPERIEKSPFWPAEEIVRRGYAAIAFHNCELALDKWDAPFTNGVFGCYNATGERAPDSWGALSAWAWGASRVMDWIETEPLLDAGHVAVVGHSRGGKTALLTGALDTRFAMACANDSGCSGVKPNRFHTAQSEPIAAIVKSFPHWFCPNYAKYAGRDDETPFDQHMLVALMAPRLCAIGDATWDHWAGQLGEWYSAQAASAVWEFLGEKGLSPKEMPPVAGGVPLPGTCIQGGSISYHCRAGGHDLTLEDWSHYMDFADRHGWADSEWEDPAVFAVRRLPQTAVCPAPEDCLVLSGDWKLRWVPSPFDAPKGFFLPTFDDADWTTFAVPGCLEPRGFGTPVYQGIGYYWKVDPPRVMGKAPDGWTVSKEPNGTGLFRRLFVLPETWKDRRVKIRFEGFASCLRLWVNGLPAGYAEDGRQGATFDITDLVKPGENLLAVRTLRLCDGTYMEDQDAWRLSGITRDVYLFSEPEHRIDDYIVRTDHGRFAIDVRIVGGEGELSVEVPGLIPERRLNVVRGRVCLAVDVPAAKLWSAEEPNLYPLVLKLVDAKGAIVQTIRTRIGFRTVERVNGQILVNGQPVLFKGVNRPETHPTGGYAVPYAQMVEDVKILKRLNANAVRTAHYPNDPRWYDLCDEYGLYVLDEANIETHGLSGDNRLLNPTVDPRFRAAAHDRVEGMVRRDRNHASVVLWSLGNENNVESDFFPEAYGRIRMLDPVRPIMNQRNGPKDFFELMYCPVKDLEEFALHGDRDIPAILCEYSHAMGNSSGNLSDYWRLIRAHRNLQGGFIWDFADQGLKKKGFWAYGGDYGEKPDTYQNFNCNGLFQPDRTPSPQTAEVRWCYQDVDVVFTNGAFEIENRAFFANLSQYEATWSYAVDGVERAKGTLADLDVPPQGKLEVALALPQSDCRWLKTVTFSFRLRADCAWAKKGHEVVCCQVVLAHGDGRGTDAGRPADLSGFDFRPNLRRAPTDNDLRNGVAEASSYWTPERAASNCTVRVDGNRVAFRYVPDSQSSARDAPRYVRGCVPHPPSLLPRAGVLFEVPRTYTRVRWFGRGPGENYPDRKSGSAFGVWESALEDFFFRYVRPQESGTRQDVFWFELIDEKGKRLRFTSVDRPFAFGVSPYTYEELSSRRHPCDLVPSRNWIVTIDAGWTGLAGEDSWGTPPWKEYTLSSESSPNLVFTVQENSL